MAQVLVGPPIMRKTYVSDDIGFVFSILQNSKRIANRFLPQNSLQLWPIFERQTPTSV